MIVRQLRATRLFSRSELSEEPGAVQSVCQRAYAVDSMGSATLRDHARKEASHQQLFRS
jgi:hypothetical protein